jgi:thioredoxin reductase (NADPH)
MNSDSDLTTGASPCNDAVDSSGLSGDLRNEDPSVRENARYYQLYPTLTDAEIGRMRRFGTLRHCSAADYLYRAASPDQSMSRYLIERVTSLPNVTLHPRVEIIALEGSERLDQVHYCCRIQDTEATIYSGHLFLFAGADPNTDWLRSCGVSLDRKGFVLTGTDIEDGGIQSPPLQTSVDGVFAIGDARAGSVKRVAAAVGEGAAVVAQIHRFLSAER